MPKIAMISWTRENLCLWCWREGDAQRIISGKQPSLYLNLWFINFVLSLLHPINPHSALSNSFSLSFNHSIIGPLVSILIFRSSNLTLEFYCRFYASCFYYSVEILFQKAPEQIRLIQFIKNKFPSRQSATFPSLNLEGSFSQYTYEFAMQIASRRLTWWKVVA